MISLNINNVYFDNMVIQIYPKLIKLIHVHVPMIPKPHFSTCICPFLMILFLPKFKIKVTILILKLAIYHFLDGDVPR